MKHIDSLRHAVIKCGRLILTAVLMMTDVSRVMAEPAATGESATRAVSRPSVVSGDSIFGVMFSLLLVIAVIFVMAWFMRRMGSAAPRSNALMKVVSGLSMGARERVVLIQVGEEQLLLGVSPGRIQTLHVLDKPLVLSNDSDSANSGFADRLKSILNKEK